MDCNPVCVNTYNPDSFREMKLIEACINLIAPQLFLPTYYTAIKCPGPISSVQVEGGEPKPDIVVTTCCEIDFFLSGPFHQIKPCVLN